MENPVVRDSDEWNTIDFALHLRCRSSRVNLLQAWNITKPETVSLFKRHSQNGAVVEAFIDSATLDRSNSVQDVCTRGFNVGSNGFKISVGNIELPSLPLTRATVKDDVAAEPSSGALDNSGKVLPARNATAVNAIYGERRVYEYFICDVAFGKSITAKDHIEAQRMRMSMPVEYDSIYLEDSEKEGFKDVTVMSTPNDAAGALDHLQEDSFTEGVLPQVSFKKVYIVYGSSQILPRYLIQFECDAAAEETFALPLCDNCQNHAATIYCPSDSAKICKKCDEQLHSHNKVVSRHVRVPLNQMPKPAARCRVHPSKLYNMYCVLCHVPICQLCTSHHIHGQSSYDGRAACFIPISNAYDAAIHEMQQQPNRIISKRREYLNMVLDQVIRLKEDVETNCRHVQASCYESMEDTLKELRGSIDKSLEVLMIEQTENKRQLTEMDWLEHFGDYIRNTLMPADYLRSWLRHCQLRKQMEDDSFKKPLKEVFPDMSLQGELSIMHEQSSEEMHA
ncbi:hypothetical protein BgAZ_302430 [Babesia gibsoni]|uniref:B box-type domain-containing protein n=1 Tax=Babesia gibsoni TaxID=33632 RepID=A0AAD8P8R1_BABGI|nr:hypothetical protein BgAZ_302430 [Babesia gibsoni]